MKFTKSMVAGNVMVGSLALIVLVGAHGHDISQDSDFDNRHDTAHTCHHMRVDYWKVLAEMSDNKPE